MTARRATLLLLGLLLGAAAEPPKQTIVLASTTSVENSGLLAHILPQFTAQTGIGVRVIALGTGQALGVAARGDADLVLVHDPVAEQKFMEDGHGVERHEIAWNDFIIVGPAADPAHIGGGHNAPAALAAIQGALKPFVSRGDGSGTHALELRLWKAARIDPTRPPGGWYVDVGSGMGAALNTAAAMDAYTLTDRGTWLAFGNKGSLRIMIEGGRALLNSYDVITLAPGEHRAAGLEPARRLANWLQAPGGQAAIGGYEVAGERLFHPVADPKPE